MATVKHNLPLVKLRHKTTRTGVTITTPARELADKGKRLPWRRASRFAFQVTRAILLGSSCPLDGCVCRDETDGRFLDAKKNFTALAVDADHRTEPVRGHNHFLGPDLHSVVS